jgi:peptidoglycan/xylan/chitin deacetylase (PgdA/CDA1 family)
MTYAGGPATAPGKALPVINLCFHGVGEPQRPLEPDEHLYWVTEERFEELLGVAADHPNVHITFDDGNASDLTIALPALQRHGLTAEFFVLAGRLDAPGSLSRAGVKALAEAGMGIGSHGMHHRPWPSLGPADLEEELRTAPEILADVTGQRVGRAACPFGAYNRRVLTALRRHGFDRIYTVDEGPAGTKGWLESRYTIRTEDTGAFLEHLALDPSGSPYAAALRAVKGVIKRWR